MSSTELSEESEVLDAEAVGESVGETVAEVALDEAVLFRTGF
jgi:hypothetical protein